jgi:hypothetical protein
MCYWNKTTEVAVVESGQWQNTNETFSLSPYICIYTHFHTYVYAYVSYVYHFAVWLGPMSPF